MSDTETVTRYCSFCGRPTGETLVLIAAQSAYICDACVLTCSDIVNARLRDRIAQVMAPAKEPV